MLKLLDLLGQLPHNWTWQQARAAMQAVATFIRAGIPVEQAEAFLTHHQRLRDLDFDETAAVAVAEALTEAGATGERREPVLRTLIGTAASHVDRDALEQELERLRAEIAQLGTLYKTLRQRIKSATSRQTNLQAAEQAALNKKARIDAECRTREADLASLQGLRALLLGKYPEIDTFLNDVERLRTLRKQGYVHIAESLTTGIRIKVIEFLQKVATEAQSG